MLSFIFISKYFFLKSKSDAVKAFLWIRTFHQVIHWIIFLQKVRKFLPDKNLPFSHQLLRSKWLWICINFIHIDLKLFWPVNWRSFCHGHVQSFRTQRFDFFLFYCFILNFLTWTGVSLFAWSLCNYFLNPIFRAFIKIQYSFHHDFLQSLRFLILWNEASAHFLIKEKFIFTFFLIAFRWVFFF